MFVLSEKKSNLLYGDPLQTGDSPIVCPSLSAFSLEKRLF